MPAQAGSLQWRIGLVGYGEVGRILAEELRAKGLGEVRAYDLKLGGPAEAPLREHAARHGVELAASHAGLAAGADLVISAVTPGQAIAAAARTKGVRPGCWFLDLNSISPAAKIEAAGIIDGAGGRFVEGAVMTSVPPYRLRVPLLLGGAYAAEFEPMLNALGFQARQASERLGVASAIKMCRSVMIKGLEAMVIESFIAARAYGVEAEVLASLAETFPGIDWEKQGTYFFQRVIQHGRRRAEEMREVAQTMREAGIEPWSASGTAERQAWVADLADKGLLGDRCEQRTDWRIDADRLIAASPRKS